MKLGFKDNFSTQAADYARFRPRYPEALFHFLASCCSNRQKAWDCGTGNGQCAISLARLFDSVIATDPSEKQLANAEPNPRVEYVLAAAEESRLPPESVDLVTVAQALHWFNIERFWNEAQRVLRPNGIIAVWCYELLEIMPQIDDIVGRFYRDTVGQYWDFERKLVEDGYRSVPFPFAEFDAPAFVIDTSWSMAHLIGYLRSWSATQKFILANNTDPTELIAQELKTAWGDPSGLRKIRWPLRMRVGRNVPRNS